MNVKLFGGYEDQLVRGLDQGALRHRLIANNVANVDTPGYQPKHLEFAGVLQEASNALELRQTDARHLPSGELGPRISVDRQARRPDGNAVDPEREMADLASNAALYAVFTQALRGRIESLRSAINEGRAR